MPEAKGMLAPKGQGRPTRAARECRSLDRAAAVRAQASFSFSPDKAPSCCLLDPVACPRLAIDWFGEKQARGSNTLRRTLELEKGKDG